MPENAAARGPLGFPSYEAAREQFSWKIPIHFNMGVDVCDRWADSDPLRPAITEYEPNGGRRTWSFGELRESPTVWRIFEDTGHSAGRQDCHLATSTI